MTFIIITKKTPIILYLFKLITPPLKNFGSEPDIITRLEISNNHILLSKSSQYHQVQFYIIN